MIIMDKAFYSWFILLIALVTIVPFLLIDNFFTKFVPFDISLLSVLTISFSFLGMSFYLAGTSENYEKKSELKS